MIGYSRNSGSSDYNGYIFGDFFHIFNVLSDLHPSSALERSYWLSKSTVSNKSKDLIKIKSEYYVLVLVNFFYKKSVSTHFTS